MGDFLTYLIISVVSFFAQALLAPTPRAQNAKPSDLGDYDFPRVDEGAPVPLVYGRFRVRGPNVLWYGAPGAAPITRVAQTGWAWITSTVVQTVGYAYRITFQVALSLYTGNGASFHRIWFGERIAYGDLPNENPISPSVTGETILRINKPNLFCGRERGGGVVGDVALYSGAWNQPANACLLELAPTENIDVFNYRGLVHMVFDDFVIGERTVAPRLSVEIEQQPEALNVGGFEGRIISRNADGEPIEVALSRIVVAEDGTISKTEDVFRVGVDGVTAEQVSDIAQALGDANPAEVLYDILTNDWGRLGLSEGLIDRESFTLAANTLKTERHGVALKIENPNDARDIMREILDQINGALFEAPDTRCIVLKLIRRGDYDLDETAETSPLYVPRFNESNTLEVVSFSTSNWNDTFNQVRVTYSDRSEEYKERASLQQDLSNINFQGRVRSTDFKYPGISNANLAAKIATRELFSLSIPIIKCRLLLNRDGARLRPGDVIMFSWEDYSIDRLILRVQKVDLGSLDNGRIAVDCVQERHSNVATIFEPPTLTEFRAPNLNAAPISIYKIFEAPKFLKEQALMQQRPGAVIPDGFDSQDSLFYYAVKPQGVTSTFQTARIEAFTRVVLGGLTEARYQGTEMGARLSSAVALSGNGDISFTTSSSNLPLANATQDQIRMGQNLVIIDDEIIAYEGFTQVDDLVTLTGVHRACLDTARATHAIGANVWFLTDLLTNVGNPRMRPDAGESIRIAPGGAFVLPDFLDARHIPIRAYKRSRSARPLPPIIYKTPRGASPPIFTVDTERVYRETKARLRQGRASSYNVFTDSPNRFGVGARADNSMLLESDYSTAANRPSISSPFPLAVGCWTRVGRNYYCAGGVINELITDSVSTELQARLDLNQTIVDAILSASGPVEIILRFFTYNHNRISNPSISLTNADLRSCTQNDIVALFTSPDVSLYSEEVTVIYE